jgi:hypothetical protein
MSNENMFEVAVRNKYRFPFRGLISVEDLWDLDVSSLDSIFKTLNSQLKKAKEESLLETRSKQDEEIDTKIAIIKYIVGVKIEEKNTRLKAKARREKKQKIMEIISAKQDADLQNKSVDELSKMLNDLAD